MSVRAGPAPPPAPAPAAREEASAPASVSRLAQVLAAGMRVSFDPLTKQATVTPVAPTAPTPMPTAPTAPTPMPTSPTPMPTAPTSPTPTGRPKSDPMHVLVEPFRSTYRSGSSDDMGCADRKWQTTDSQRRNSRDPTSNDYRPRSIYRWEPDRVYTRAMRERAAAPAPAAAASRAAPTLGRRAARNAAARPRQDAAREAEAERQKKLSLKKLPYQVPNDFFDGGAQRVRQPETSAEAMVRYALEALGMSPVTAVSTPMTTSPTAAQQPTTPNRMPFPKIYLIDGSNVFHSMLMNENYYVKAINRVSYFPNDPQKSIASYFRRRTLTRNAFFHMSKYTEQQTTQDGGRTQWRDLTPSPSAASADLLSQYRVNIRSTIADVLNRGDVDVDEMRIGLDGFMEGASGINGVSEPALAMQAPVIIVFNEKSYHLLVDSTAASSNWDKANAEQYRSWGFTVSPPGFPSDRCPNKFGDAARQSIFHMPRDGKGVSMFYRVLEATAVMHNWSNPVVFVPIHAEQQTADKANEEGSNSKAKLVKYDWNDLTVDDEKRRQVDDRETTNDKTLLKNNESKCEFLLPDRYDASNRRKTGTSLSHGWCEWDDCIISRMRDHLDELGFSVDCISSDTNLYKTDAPFADGDLPDYVLPTRNGGVEKDRNTALYHPRDGHTYTTGPRASSGSRPLLYPAIARKHFFDEFEKHLDAVVSDLVPTSLRSRYSSARWKNGYGIDAFSMGPPEAGAATYMQSFRTKMDAAWNEMQVVKDKDVGDAGRYCQTDVGLPLKFKFQLPRRRWLVASRPGQPFAFKEDIAPDEQVVHIYGNADRALYYLALLSQSTAAATAVDGSVLALENPMLREYSPDPYPQKYLLPGYRTPGNPRNLRQPEPYYTERRGFRGEIDVGGDVQDRDAHAMETRLMRIRTWVLQHWMRTKEPGDLSGQGHGVKGDIFRQGTFAIQHHQGPFGHNVVTDFRSQISPRDIVAFAQGFTRDGSISHAWKGSNFENCSLLQHELLRDRLVMLRDAANYLQWKHRTAADSNPNKATFRDRFWKAVQIANKECSMLKLDALRDAATVQSGGESAIARIRLQQETAELQMWLAVKRQQPLSHTPMGKGTSERREVDRSGDGVRLANSDNSLGKFDRDQRHNFLRAQYTNDQVTQDRIQRQNTMAVHIGRLTQGVVADEAFTIINQLQYLETLQPEEKETLFEACKEDAGIGTPTRIH